MERKAKMIASIVAVAMVAVFSIVGLVIVLAAYTVNVTNDYTISYTAKGVACDVSASYRKVTFGDDSAGVYTTIKSGANDKITFTGKDTSGVSGGTYSSQFDTLSNETIGKNQFFVFKYVIDNTKSNLYYLILYYL